MSETKLNPPVENEAVRSEQAKLELQEGFQRLELEELKQPPKPVPNKGLRGAELSQKIAQFRQQLQGRYDTAMAHGARRLVSQTVKETIVEDIVRQKTSGKSRSQLEQLPIGELHEFLPRFDWRPKAVVPAVRDQGTCGSCWAHTATAVLESNLRIQLANFATNNMDFAPETFFVSWVDLNVNSTLNCVAPRSCKGGRYETAFNYYFKRGIPLSEVSLNGTPLNQPAPAQPVSKIPKRDTALPEGHCQNSTTDRIKIVGWDYVNQAKPFAVPPVEALKKSLLEHGPLAVGINTKGLEEYGELRLLEQSEELGTNADTGIRFKREQVSGGLLVCIPAKLVRKQAVPSLLNREFFNLNLPKGGDRRYQFLPEAAAIFTQGTHLRAAPQDLDVVELSHRTTDVFVGPGKVSTRETKTFILHFPASNAVNLEQDPATGKFALSFPQNSAAKIRRNSGGERTLVIPWQPAEDLTPVFEARADLPFNHYVLVVGWDDRKQAWIMQNSWGEAWGFDCGFESDGFGNQVAGGYAYVRYGTFGQFAAWLEAPLLEHRLAEGLKRVPTP